MNLQYNQGYNEPTEFNSKIPYSYQKLDLNPEINMNSDLLPTLLSCGAISLISCATGCMCTKCLRKEIKRPSAPEPNFDYGDGSLNNPYDVDELYDLWETNRNSFYNDVKIKKEHGF